MVTVGSSFRPLWNGGERSAAGAADLRCAQANGELVQAPKHQPVAVRPLQLVAGDGQPEFGESVEQGPEGDARLQPRQRRSEAEVNAVPEPQVRAGDPADVEL